MAYYIETMNGIINCPDCGSQNGPEGKFCVTCGYDMMQSKINKLEQQPSQTPQQDNRANFQYNPQQMGQYLSLKVSKTNAIIVSFCCIPGGGLLFVDTNKYMGKFIISFLLSWIFIGWILGIVWTAEAVDEKNRLIAMQLNIHSNAPFL